MEWVSARNSALTALFPGQEALIDAVKRRGYAVDHEALEYNFDFATGDLDRALPSGFHFVDPADASWTAASAFRDDSLIDASMASS